MLLESTETLGLVPTFVQIKIEKHFIRIQMFSLKPESFHAKYVLLENNLTKIAVIIHFIFFQHRQFMVHRQL